MPAWPRTRRWSAAVAGALGLLAISAPGVAWAHAEVVDTYPAAGAAPQRVTHLSVTFNEPVDIVPRALGLATDLGVAVALDQPRQVSGTQISARLQDRAAPGGYVATWRVRADDGHIESGIFPFRIAGAPGGGDLTTTTTQQAPPPAGDEDPVWPVIVAACLALAAGAGAALVVRRGLRGLASPDPLYPAEKITRSSQGDHAPSSE
jgi:methionine-rich copper-binding protein CopC